MKRFFIVLLFLFISILSISSSSATPGCCCYNINNIDTYEWGETVTEAYCNSLSGEFNSTYGEEECIVECIPNVCEYDACDGQNNNPSNLPCRCGLDIITPETGQYCCAADPDQKIYSNGENCFLLSVCTEPDINYYSISGNVVDEDSVPIEEATVTATGGFSDTTDEFGDYIIEDVAEGDAVTVTAAAPYCGAEDQTIVLDQDKDNINFALDCTEPTTQCNDIGQCCGPGFGCIGGTPYGQMDCAFSYTCYEGCSGDCVLLEPGGETCTYGACNYEQNLYCNVNNEWQFYDLDEPDEFNEYCSLCPNDGNCANQECQSDGECNGICPTNCGPGDDPDCRPDCDEDANAWCDTYAIYGENKEWFYFDLNDATQLNNYCSECALYDPIDCEAECGNGIVEWGEDCDPGPDPTPYCVNCQNVIPETCGDGQYEPQYEECDLSSSSSWQDQCTPPDLYQGCSNSCECIEICKPENIGPLAITGLNLVSESPNIEISWNLPGDCILYLESINIYRCEGNSIENCSVFQPFIGGLSSTQDTYTDVSSKHPNWVYGYYIDYNFTFESSVRTPPEYITTGNQSCMEPHDGDFCIGDNLAYCDENNIVHLTECPGACYTTLIGDDYCSPAGFCEDCNSLYGMYSYFTLLRNEDDWRVQDSSGDFYPCAILLNETCYIDKTNKTVEKTSACTDVKTCYDYNSYDTCINDPCHRFLDEELECEWNALGEAGTDIEAGICAPVVPEIQECGKCLTDNPLFPTCNYELCNLFGDCYFAAYNPYVPNDPEYPKCGGLNEMRCKDYTQKEHCIGEEGQNFALNMDNTPAALSEDRFNFGKCKWYEPSQPGESGKCYRDADDSYTGDSYPSPAQVDCDASDLECEKDFESPNTTIDFIAYEQGHLFNKSFLLPFFVSDNIYGYGDDGMYTYFCFTPKDESPGDCEDAHADAVAQIPEHYEQLELNELDPGEKVFSKEFEESEEQQEEYVLYYFSKDKAHNLEEANAYNFILDAHTPNYTMTYNYISYQIVNGWRSDLFVNVEFDETVFCSINLKDLEGEEQGISIYDQIGVSFYLEYPNIPDDTYWLNIVCYDEAGNKVNESEQVKVEGDKSITNIFPDYDILNYTTVTLSVETMNNGTCRYSTETYLYSEMGEIEDHINRKYEGTFNTSDNKHHTKTITFPGSGVYQIFTACNISSDQQGETVWNVTEGNDGDKIVFSIDQLAPVTVLYNQNTGEELDTEKYYSELDVEFKCEEKNYYVDENDMTWGMTLGQSFDGSFGCEKITFYDGYFGIQDYTSPFDEASFPLDGYESVAHDYELVFQSKDSASPSTNKEELRNATIHIDPVDANLTLEVQRNNQPVNVITFGNNEIIVTSQKEIEEKIIFSYKIYFGGNIPSNETYSLLPYVEDIDDYSFRAYLQPDYETFYGEEGDIEFNVEIEDTSGLISFAEFTVPFDTSGPPAPELEPIFKDAMLQNLGMGINGKSYMDNYGNWYPFRHYDSVILANGDAYTDLYFSTDESLFITGYTNLNIQGEVLFYLADEGQNAFTPKHIYDQLSENNMGSSATLSSKKLKEDANFGESYLILNATNGDLPEWNTDNYIVLSPPDEKSARTDYNNYGKYYAITESTSLGADGYRINVSPALQENLDYGHTIYLLEKDHPYEWFGTNVETEYSPSGNNIYNLTVKLNDSLNIGEGPSMIFMIDSQGPVATEVFPLQGVIAENQPLEVTFKEHLGGSGLKEDKLSFTIIEDGNTEVVTQADGVELIFLGAIDQYQVYKAEYLPAGGWSEGLYNVTLNIQDQAGNELNPNGFYTDQVWFMIDEDLPSPPEYSVDQATEDNIDYHNRIVIDEENPTFELDFTYDYLNQIEPSEISVPEITLTSTATPTNTVCSRSEGNVFNCSFDSALNEGLHSFYATANKQNGPAGDYYQDKNGLQLAIISDSTAPDFTLNPERMYVGSNQAITIYANVTNEDFDLEAEVVVGGEQATLETEKNGDQYFFIIPEDFDWGIEGEKTVYVTLKDFAGNENTETTSVIYDTTPPAIVITNIEAESSFLISNTEATVGVRDITIIGLVDSDAERICYEQQIDGGESGCIFECEGGNVDNCITRQPGDDEFRLTMIVIGPDSVETLNTIEMTVRDFSGSESNTILGILLDLLAPGEPTITFN